MQCFPVSIETFTCFSFSNFYVANYIHQHDALYFPGYQTQSCCNTLFQNPLDLMSVGFIEHICLYFHQRFQPIVSFPSVFNTQPHITSLLSRKQYIMKNNFQLCQRLFIYSHKCTHVDSTLGVSREMDSCLLELFFCHVENSPYS